MNKKKMIIIMGTMGRGGAERVISFILKGGKFG